MSKQIFIFLYSFTWKKTKIARISLSEGIEFPLPILFMKLQNSVFMNFKTQFKNKFFNIIQL